MTDVKTVLRQLGAKVTYFRTVAGISQEELARRVNRSPSTIVSIESGWYKSLGIPLLVSVANAMDADLSLMLQFGEVERRLWNSSI